MKRIVLFAALALLCCGVIDVQAQTALATPLSSGDSKRGVLLSDESITLDFSVPAQEDMIITLSADKVVVMTVCVEIDGPPICPSGSGGGDGDPPTSNRVYVPSSDKAQTVDVSLYRPLDSAANYQLETFGVSPAGVGLDEKRTVSNATAKTPYKSYLLNVNPAQPFVIEIEDTNSGGDYLWVAHEPFINSAFKAKDTRQTFPQRIDAANRDDNPSGISDLELFYMGGSEFRLLVMANGAFLLNSRALNTQKLDADMILPLTISYRNPVGVVRLNTQPEDVAKVDFQIAQGSRAVVEVYQEGGSIGDSLELGYDSNKRTTVPIAGTIHEVATERPLYALIQLGDGSTRDPIPVTMEWTREG